ncbi:YciI family protein [Hyphobacterium sp.]|uniref:YciI family protein n=1 Tax=Hyphobacterium sp. TaxID=2004662 RepID=UPI003BA939DA
MKFTLLLHDDETRWLSMSDAEQEAVVGEHMAYSEALEASGAFVSGEPLDPAATSKIVTTSSVEDGPYADSKEQLGGFYVIETATLEEALDWARKCPAAKTGKVEVRPVPDYGG